MQTMASVGRLFLDEVNLGVSSNYLMVWKHSDDLVFIHASSLFFCVVLYCTGTNPNHYSMYLEDTVTQRLVRISAEIEEGLSQQDISETCARYAPVIIYVMYTDRLSHERASAVQPHARR